MNRRRDCGTYGAIGCQGCDLDISSVEAKISALSKEAIKLVKVNVSDPGDVNAAMAEIVPAFDKVDVLIKLGLPHEPIAFLRKRRVARLSRFAVSIKSNVGSRVGEATCKKQDYTDFCFSAIICNLLTTGIFGIVMDIKQLQIPVLSSGIAPLGSKGRGQVMAIDVPVFGVL